MTFEQWWEKEFHGATKDSPSHHFVARAAWQAATNEAARKVAALLMHSRYHIETINRAVELIQQESGNGRHS